MVLATEWRLFMQLVFNGLLIFFMIIYVAIIAFYVESIGVFYNVYTSKKKDAISLAVCGALIGITYTLHHWLNIGPIIAIIITTISVIILVMWFIRQKNHIETLNTLLFFSCIHFLFFGLSFYFIYRKHII